MVHISVQHCASVLYWVQECEQHYTNELYKVGCLVIALSRYVYSMVSTVLTCLVSEIDYSYTDVQAKVDYTLDTARFA